MRYISLALLLTILIGATASAQKADSLMEVISRNKKDIEQAKAMNNLAAELMRTDPAKAKGWLHSTVLLSQDIGSARFESSAYTQLVSLHNNNANTDSASYFLQKLAALSARATGAEKKDVEANYYGAAGLYHKKAGNLPMAASFMKKAIAAAGTTSNRSNLAGQMMNLGNTYNLMGQYKDAISYHLKALKIFEEEANAKGQSFCYQNIANSFIELKQFSAALPYASKSLAIKKSLNDTRGTGTTLNALGQIYQGLNKPAAALSHYQQALEVMRSFKLVPEQAKLNYNMGKLFLITKDTTTALRHLEESRSFALQLADSSLLSSVELQMIAVKNGAKNTVKAEQNMLAGVEKLQLDKQLSKEATGYEHVAEFYAANQQYEKALEYTKKYYAYKDSINNNEILGQIKTIEEQYNLDKKEKEIAILKKDQQLQQAKLEKQKLFQVGGIAVILLILGIAWATISRYRALQKAREQLQMEKLRNGIARDLHDDIGSTLTSINILSKVLLQQKENGEADTQKNLHKIKEHSSSIMESMSDIVWAINPQNDTVEKVIMRMKEFAAEVLDPLNIDYEFKETGNLSDATLTVDKRKDLFLIFKEAINNAAKYSNCSFINISLHYNGQHIQLGIKDNGKGFDQETVKKGNGLNNIFARSQNMLGALQFKTSVGEGTDMQLLVPSHH